MTHDLLDLGRRAVACPRWRWMRGMSTLAGTMEKWSCVNIGHPVEAEYTARGALPDLSDPATLGCILALVREAWQDAGVAYCYPVADGWHVVARGRVLAWGTIEPAALVAALEAAP